MRSLSRRIWGSGFIAGFKAGDYLAELQAARAAEAGVLAALLAQEDLRAMRIFLKRPIFGPMRINILRN